MKCLHGQSHFGSIFFQVICFLAQNLNFLLGIVSKFLEVHMVDCNFTKNAKNLVMVSAPVWLTERGLELKVILPSFHLPSPFPILINFIFISPVNYQELTKEEVGINGNEKQLQAIFFKATTRGPTDRHPDIDYLFFSIYLVFINKYNSRICCKFNRLI